MNWSHYDQQEDREPFDILLEAKGSVEPADREHYDREVKVQSYLRMVKMNADSAGSPLEQLRDFVDRSPAPDAGYCRARLDGKISCLLKWHYCLALYFAQRGDWLAKAIPLILKSAEQAGDSSRSSSYLLLAHNLNRWHNCNMGSAVLESALRHMREHRGDAHAHWCAKIVEDLERRPEVRDEMRDLLLAVADKAKPDMMFLHLKAAIGVADDKAPARAACVRAYERYADEVQDLLLKISYYNDAKEYLDDNEGQRRINAKIKEAQKHVKLDKFTHEWKVPEIDIPGATGFERVRHLVGTLQSSMPNVESAQMEEKKMREMFPIQHLFARISIGSDGVPGQRPGAAGPDGDAADHTGQFANRIRFLKVVLSANVRGYEADGRIKGSDYEGYLETFGLLPDAAKRLVGAGIKAHFSGNYVASVHILVPQLEQALRLLLEQKGVQTLGGRDRVRQDLLKRMIAEGEGVLGRDLAEFLRVWLVDEGSVNLRNRVCHALYGDYQDMDGYDPLHEFWHGTSLLLILVICLLVGMSTDASESPQPGP